MADMDSFLAEVARDLKLRLDVLDDPDERRGVEDGIALLTDYRLGGLDEPLFQRLLTMLRRGRSPVRLLASQPETLAAILAHRWRTYEGQTGTPALG